METMTYRQPEWIGTDGVNRDSGLETEETFLSRCLFRLEPRVPIYPVSHDAPRLTIDEKKH